MSESASFVVKPARGWLHPDLLIAKEGVTYSVRYIGCLEVLMSMKKLDFETRSHVAKECINRVCEAAGLKSADKKRRVDKSVVRAIAEKPRMTNTGANVALTICSRSLTITALEGNDLIARHDMPRISFASGGDTDTLDFVAYVAKNLQDWRACYVLECGGRLAQDVISTIGQAFELRFKEFLTKPSSLNWNGLRSEVDRDYYNDMPGKMPPEFAPPVPPLPAPTTSKRSVNNVPCDDATGNLIELGSPTVLDSAMRHYVNHTPPPRTPPTAILPHAQNTDIFDMQPFTGTGEALSATQQRALLVREPWFHGEVSRTIAEQLLVNDGDFLVRESTGCAGQYVLTGVRRGQRKHLLLVDPEGVVRTKDRIFDSVPHLINYHCSNELPIVSADSALLLRRPVPRQT